MVHLIVRHTPKSMRMYSKILLQTCATDFALLTINLLFHQYMFTTDKGESEVIAGGLITFNGTQNRGLNLLAWDWKQTMGFYYIIIACTIAYMIIITLAFLMDKLLNERLKLGASSALTVKMIEINKQISRNLIIQYYRKTFVNGFKRIVRLLNYLHSNDQT
uniref:Uncharacterized protein n=1 Tax=Globodera rostochiensis TaxID=31243 RepID=A0A914H429_GLORO